jgi:hypothetical protein
MKNGITGRNVERAPERLERLYYWLSYHRFTAFFYGGGLYLPWAVVFWILVVLAVLFAPYMLFVLYKNGKSGWLTAFPIVVGVPIGIAFVPTGSYPFDTLLHFLPLLAFYFYCFALRFSVIEWISDTSPTAALWANAKERNDRDKL